jgi:hypothetical protein
MSTEQTIIAYFPSSTKAESATMALATIGITDVHVKRNSHAGVSLHDEGNQLLASTAETLTGLTLFSNTANDMDPVSSRILVGSDPASSHAFTVVAFVRENQAAAAINLLKQYDGEV